MYVPSPVIVATGGIGNWLMGGIACDAVARSQYVSACGEGWGASDAEGAAGDADGDRGPARDQDRRRNGDEGGDADRQAHEGSLR